MMWVPLLACLTAGIVSVPRCQRGPGALLGAARLLAAVPGLCQRRSEANFMLKVRPLEKYPVDLYYLVDVSASMHNNIEKLNSVGFALSKKMANISLDFRLGFGSYVDKTVSPYISIHPGRIHNQCSDYNLDCMPPHGYIHVLSLTDNIAEFRNAVNKQKISGNIDTPEGGFDAMLQAAVCQSHIGWRKEAKRLLLVMTDQTSHLALDSKLAGIVIPHDGNCHLKDNVYIKATSMEHPSLGQLSEKLIDNNINVIFAVQGSQFHWYKDLLPLLPGTVARQIESQAANLNDLVVEAYQKLISEVKLQVDNQIQGLNFNITAICPDGSKKTGMEGCKNVGYNKEVLFNVSVAMKGCHTAGGRKYAILKPIGFNETAIVNVQQSCACQYGDSADHNRVWAEETSDSKQSHCSDSNCSSHREDTLPSERCRQYQDQPICSGQGNCIDGKCFCYKNKLGKVYGKYCEMDDFSCPYHQGNLCSGTVFSAIILTIHLKQYLTSAQPHALTYCIMLTILQMPMTRKRLAAQTLQRGKKPKLQPLKPVKEGHPHFSHIFDTSHLKFVHYTGVISSLAMKLQGKLHMYMTSVLNEVSKVRPRQSQCPELEDYDCENDQLPVDPEIVWDLLLQLDSYKSMGPDGIHPRILKELANDIAKALCRFLSCLGNLKRSQLTGSWQMLSRFSRRARRRTLETKGLSISFECLVKL
ncbi:integrin subunit beta 8 [Pitangus sulphuratus]|nr:integrin subunit beta 8 [Pitangus sulphuratus]